MLDPQEKTTLWTQPFINQQRMKLQIEERNFIAETKSKNWNCKTKKCLKEEKPKTKNEKQERGEERREGLNQNLGAVIQFSSFKAYKSVLNPST